MHAGIKQQWIEELIRHSRNLGSRYLFDGSRYCPLGLLCRLHALATGNEFIYNRRRRLWSYLGRYNMVPRQVRDWAGLSRAHAGRIARFGDEGRTGAAIAVYVRNKVRTGHPALYPGR